LENKFIIKVKVLNHRWIIADFSDGEYWGEVLLKYFVNDDQTITFEINQSLLYQKKKGSKIFWNLLLCVLSQEVKSPKTWGEIP
jgi:hypothetical protein